MIYANFNELTNIHISADVVMTFLCSDIPTANKLGAKSLYEQVQVLPDLNKLGKTAPHFEYTQKIGSDVCHCSLLLPPLSLFSSGQWLIVPNRNLFPV
jgi:hypothetical protein